MNETRKRIKAYKAALPALRERVVAVALLLAMSVAMMTSASFAWLTISRRPELTGVNTTVAANGNLEIALASPDGSKPGESQVGDSSANKDQSVAAANLTWGNLVNLSDAAYGLENLTMRPAQLNTASLLDSPLYGAVYGSDGRIEQLSSNFGYATWNLPDGDKPGYFGVSDDYGVRAISSTTIEAVGADALYHNMLSAAKDKNLAAATMYTSLGSNSKYMPSLATMMGLYMTARMNPSHATLSNPDCKIEDIQNLRDMYAAFLDCFDMEADAIAALVNLQLFLLHGENGYTPYTADMIYATTTAKLANEGVQVTRLDELIKDRNIIVSDLEKLKEICSSGTSLKWQDSGLNNIVNNLVNVGACTIGADNTPISSIGASNAMGYLMGTQEARITNGILLRFEERTGGYIEVKGLGISATVNRLGMTIPATVKANIQTTASRDYNLFTNDLTHAEGMNDGSYKGGIPVAEDTYGLAIDLWVRTNASGSYLTLEGNVLAETEMVRATATDANGNVVELYTITLSGEDEEGNTASYSMDVYQHTAEDGTVTWYNADSHIALTDTELGGVTPTAKMEEISTVIGYEGENRIWTENDLLTTDSTTQGSGSCYVYYADTPEDQARSLKLLEAFNVAFVNDEGKLMASAIMDTENYYAASGRVIVPLVLSTSNSINLGEDYEGNVTYAITNLEKNVAKRITAIVYLDGTKLTNKEVLAAADIQGQLNIQFGSSMSLAPISNETLESAVRQVSASVDKTEFNYDTATEPMTTNVTVRVSGDEPSTVTAFFLRSISATQGSREQEMTFTKNDAGEWVSSYTFTTPGTYILRTVRLDGVDYDLATTPTVSVKGFTVASLSCTQATDNHLNVLTAAASTTADMTLKFATDDIAKLPKTVVGRFLRDDGSAVNVAFTMDANQIWRGSATFLTSGNYTMQYLVLDGEYVELDPAFWHTATVTLGMRVAVYTTSPLDIMYQPNDMADNEKNLGMQVKLMDNAGNEMPGLTGAKLTYNMKGSGIKKMDTELTWNGTYYIGELHNEGPGVWQFNNVTVGSNTITYATTSPTFTVMSPEPPEYYDHRTQSYQYNVNGTASMDVQITNSAAASAQALIVKADGTETWVTGTIGNELTTEDGKSANHWLFVVPKDANGYQDGNWKLTRLKLWNVFSADGTAYTEEAPLLIDVSDSNNVTKVVSRAITNFTENKSQDFGKDAGGNVTAAFMQSHTISGLSVDIADFEGQPISGITDVQVKFTYTNGTSSAYGGYTSDSLTNGTEGATITVPLTADSTGKHFVQGADATIRYAGAYSTEFSYKVNGTPYSFTGEKLPTNAPQFTVSSVTPTVTITGATTYTNSTRTETSAVVYFNVSQNSTCGITTTNYSQPNVTITLAGYGNASGATLQFTASNNGDVHLYINNGDAASKKTTTYEWSENGACRRWVGYYQQVSAGSDQRTVAGTLTANALVMTYGNESFTFTLSNAITISNPS